MDPTQKRRAIVNLVVIIIGLGLFGFLVKQAWSSWKAPQPPVPNTSALAEARKEALIISAEEANKILKSGQKNVIVLDIQERHKFKKEHIPSAINIPADELEIRAPGELSKSDLIIIVDCACDGTNTVSLLRHKVLVDMGFQNVAVMDEGLNAWKAMSFELAVDKQ